MRSAYNLEEDAFDVYEKVQSSLDTYLKEILRYEIQKVEIIHKKLIKESIRILDEGGQSGVPSGLNLLDYCTNGWQKTDLVLLAGRPGMGKTAAMITMAMNAG